MIKHLRKFDNIKLLCLLENENLKTKVVEELKNCKNMSVVSTIDGQQPSEMKYDIVVMDYNFTEAYEFITALKKSKPHLPMIVLTDSDDDETILKCLNLGASSILSKQLNFINLRLAMITALNTSKRVDKVSFKDGIYYDIYRERFYNNDSAIKFTNYEFLVLKLLLDNKEEPISYEFIKEKVWKEKKMSIFTMRNIINKIRKKTYYDIIKNNSSKGYQIDTIAS